MTLPADALEQKMTDKLVAQRGEVQMKGFRKGKVPMPLLRKMFGKSMLGEVVQESVDGAVRAHFEACGDRPAMQPDIKITNEQFDEGQDLVIQLSYEKLPDVPETDFSAIALDRPVAKVDDADLTEALQNLADNAKSFEPRADGEAAQTGDQVMIDFLGRVDGEPFDGGAAEDYALEIGSGSFIPGFEEQLIGLARDEARDVTVTFPENYGAAALAGKEAVFAVTCKDIKAPAKAEINDDLAVKFGAENLEDLKKQIHERLVTEYRAAARTLVKRKLLDALDTAVTFDLPPSLVEMTIPTSRPLTSTRASPSAACGSACCLPKLARSRRSRLPIRNCSRRCSTRPANIRGKSVSSSSSSRRTRRHSSSSALRCLRRRSSTSSLSWRRSPNTK
jgi:trigger factor